MILRAGELWFRRRRPRSSTAVQPAGLSDTQMLSLADQVEAFVNGRLIALCIVEGHSIAPWMIVNRLAHADTTEIQRVARGTACALEPSSARRHQRSAWALAERWLAEQVVASCQDADQVRRVQRDVLVPLELSLAKRSATSRIALGNVLAEAVDALDDHRRNR